MHSASDYRATIAASLLRRGRLPNVVTLMGGIAAWESTPLPPVAAE